MTTTVHLLPYPGGLVPRLLRYVLKGIEPYPNLAELSPPRREAASLLQVQISIGKGTLYREVFHELSAFPSLWVYLHGSQADGTGTPFSDWDDLVVVDLDQLDSAETKRLIKALNQVDMRFCRLDPLQHHGHWIISRQSLANYDESFMPLVVLSNGAVIQGPPHLEATVDPEATLRGLRRNLEQNAQTIEALYARLEQRPLNAYELKALVGSLALMPAFVFQLGGERLDKRTAILRAGEIYSPEALRCLEWATNCRAEWGKVMALPGMVPLRLLAQIFSNPFLYRRLAERLAPRVDVKVFGFDRLNKTSVRTFLAESRRVLSHASPG